MLLSWRNKRSSFMQLFASFFFVFLIFAVHKANEAQVSSSTSYRKAMDPRPLVSPPIPRCEDKFYAKTPCFDFVWSGNGSARIRRIVRSIMANNPGRSIPSSKVKSFRTKAEVDEWLNGNAMQCSGALHFVERNASVISYGVQVNSTSLANRGRFQDPTFEFQIPLQIAAEREIARSLIGGTRRSSNRMRRKSKGTKVEVYIGVKMNMVLSAFLAILKKLQYLLASI